MHQTFNNSITFHQQNQESITLNYVV